MSCGRSRSEGSFHYPPLSPEEVIILDSTEQSDTSHETNDEQDLPVYGLLKSDRIQLDSLLSEIGCGLVRGEVPYHFLVARWHGWLSATCGKQAC